ncbi:hypothetical protein AJ80_02574 [Polytolypa hystricis UAMH7299]|uniref:Chromatin structure-remodeling complex protein RSC7 n=1 Tax=Polytolypa hystricis (strain UAMH7299) TaxID=1447883 RepID=A0A2B7YR35_POLH7|nr:hypothetical protein AJ80_02574 [Polytolypa hystricis UAMH7299]
MPRRPRAAAQAAAKSMKAAPDPLPNPSDDEMPDAPSRPSTSHSNVDEAVSEEQDVQSQKEPDAHAEEGTAATTPARDSDQHQPPSRPDTPVRGGVSAGRAVRGRRRLGRPPKNKPPDWDAPLDDGEEGTRSLVTTPVRRGKRGRPAAGGRWARSRGGPSHVTQVPVDKEGNMMDVVNDEVDLPEDPEGETKVDKLGNLLGGREYRVRTFTILNRGERHYMLSTEPARCIGFRDSYLFFQKHKQLFKIIIDDDEKRDLIEREIIPHSYKGRAIGVVTARSVFREFGAKIIIGGRKVIDDYTAQAARERGDIEGELAVPEDRLPGPGETYDRNRYVAWHGASAVYHSGAPSVPMPAGKITDAKKRRVVVTGDNWKLEHARAASLFNSRLLAARREAQNGVYDIHTNTMQYPQHMQPTHARWEAIPPPEQDRSSALRLMNSASNTALGLTNGNSNVGTNGERDNNEQEQPDNTASSASRSQEQESTIFPPVPGIFSRNFAVHDIVYQSPQYSTFGVPGPDGHINDIGYHSLARLAEDHNGKDDNPASWSPTEEVLNALPPDCRAAYDEAVKQAREWKRQWRGEAQDGHRANLPLNYSWNP